MGYIERDKEMILQAFSSGTVSMDSLYKIVGFRIEVHEIACLIYRYLPQIAHRITK